MESELLGALVGAGATIAVAVAGAAGVVINGRLEHRREKAAIKGALFAEVRALCCIIEGRRYREDLAASALHIQKTKEAIAFTVPVPEHYCSIYRTHLSSVGTLSPEDAAAIVRFYQLVDSVVRDVTPGGVIAGGTDDPQPFIQAKEFLDEAIDLADRLKS